jgi:nicotinate-nucleotide adenylyltransferase
MSEWHPGPAPRRIGIYGGTFDPVHHGHLVAAAEVHATLGLDHLVFMPAGQPPHKRDLTISDATHRVRMLELAIAGRTQFALSTRDLAPDRPSYTVDLLAHLHEAWGAGHTLFFVMGEDSLRDFPKWRAPAQIAALAQLAVVTRPNVAVEVEAIIRAVPTLAGRVHPVTIPQLDIASHDLRERVAAARPIAYQVPEAVERYIHETGLYRASATN